MMDKLEMRWKINMIIERKKSFKCKFLEHRVNEENRDEK